MPWESSADFSTSVQPYNRVDVNWNVVVISTSIVNGRYATYLLTYGRSENAT